MAEAPGEYARFASGRWCPRDPHHAQLTEATAMSRAGRPAVGRARHRYKPGRDADDGVVTDESFHHAHEFHRVEGLVPSCETTRGAMPEACGSRFQPLWPKRSRPKPAGSHRIEA
jgi:hypothetical protein